MTLPTIVDITIRKSGQALMVGQIMSDLTMLPCQLPSEYSIHTDDPGRLSCPVSTRFINALKPLEFWTRVSGMATMLGTHYADNTVCDEEIYVPDPIMAYVELAHTKYDERGNTVTDQKKRGGIAG